jgi:CRP/FNR family transcriptional regulator
VQRLTPAHTARLLQQYPAVASIQFSLQGAALATEIAWIEAPAGAALFDEGGPCRGFPLVISGEVRVARGSPHGRELELYRVLSGEVCVASTACTVGALPMLAHGTAVQASELALLSAPGFNAGARRCRFAISCSGSSPSAGPT